MAETALQAEKDRSDARYAAAKSVVKKLGTLDAADRLMVLRHVLVELSISAADLAPKQGA